MDNDNIHSEIWIIMGNYQSTLMYVLYKMIYIFEGWRQILVCSAFIPWAGKTYLVPEIGFRSDVCMQAPYILCVCPTLFYVLLLTE